MEARESHRSVVTSRGTHAHRLGGHQMNTPRPNLTRSGFVIALIVGATTAQAQITDTRIPLNYNFYGMAHSAAITGGVDEWTAAATNANADLSNSVRSVADRALVFDAANNRSPAFYSGQNIGNTGLSYAFFDTL